MGYLKRTLGHTVVYAVGLAVNRGLSLVLLPLYTRQLAPEAVGTWELCTTTVIFLLCLLELGMATTVVRFYHLYESAEKRSRVLGSSLSLLSLATVIAAACAFTFSEALAKLIFSDAAQAGLVNLVALVTVATVLGNQFLAWLRAQNRSAVFSVLSIVRSGVALPAIIYLVVGRDMGVQGILWGDFAGLAALVLLGFIICRKNIRLGIDMTVLKPMLAFGAPLVLMSLGNAFITVSDRYMLRAWVGLDKLGVFGVGFRIAMVLALLNRAFQTAWPAAAFSIAKENDAAQGFAKIFRFVLSSMCLAAVGLSAFAPELLGVFGPRETYMKAAYVIPLIAFAYALDAAIINILSGFAITRRTGFLPIIICSTACVKLALSVALIKTWGMIGAAAGTLAAFSFEFVLAYNLSQRVYRVPHNLPKIVGVLIACAVGLSAILAGFGMPMLPGAFLRFGTLGAFTAFIVFGIAEAAERRQAVELVTGLTRLVFARAGEKPGDRETRR